MYELAIENRYEIAHLYNTVNTAKDYGNRLLSRLISLSSHKDQGPQPKSRAFAQSSTGVQQGDYTSTWWQWWDTRLARDGQQAESGCSAQSENTYELANPGDTVTYC